MENNPQVAIMIPVYNGEKTLPLALASLVNQTYHNWKCYMVNDGSTDRTKEILDGLNDVRFEVIHFEQNKGRPFARQAALDKAEGKYLALLDADDFYHPDKLTKQVLFMESNPDIHLVGTGVGSFDSSKGKLLRIRGDKKIHSRKFKIGQELSVVHGSCMLRLDDAKKIKYNKKLKYAQDMDFLTRYLKGRKYANLPDVLYYYSEFNSVTAKKILKTRWYGLMRKINLIRYAPLPMMLSVIKHLLKWLLTAIMIPFTGAVYFINNRGKKPTMDETQRFLQTFQNLN